MKTTCTGRKVSLKDSFTDQVTKRLDKLDKFFSENAEAHVTVTVERNYQKVEITVWDGSFVARAERTADRMEDAFNAAADVLQKNIVKNRRKISERIQQPIPQEELLGMQQEEEIFDLIREKRFVVNPASVDEAILQMNMLGHNFYMFRDVDSYEVNVVYKRNDGGYGVLIPKT